MSVTTSCSGRNSDKEREDSISTADSIAAAEIESSAKQVSIDSIRQDSIENANPLTFQTFCHPHDVEGITLQDFYKASQIEKSLKSFGYELIGTTQETRPDYTGEEYYTVTLKTFIRNLGNKSTTVILDCYDSSVLGVEILFPNLEEVDKFKSTIKGTLQDDRVHYWATIISYNGTKVKIEGGGGE